MSLQGRRGFIMPMLAPEGFGLSVLNNKPGREWLGWRNGFPGHFRDFTPPEPRSTIQALSYGEVPCTHHPYDVRDCCLPER